MSEPASDVIAEAEHLLRVLDMERATWTGDEQDRAGECLKSLLAELQRLRDEQARWLRDRDGANSWALAYQAVEEQATELWKGLDIKEAWDYPMEVAERWKARAEAAEAEVARLRDEQANYCGCRYLGNGTGVECLAHEEARVVAEVSLLTAQREIGEHDKEREGIRRFLAGEQVGGSSDISESPSYGYGTLDVNGFWEYPVPAALVDLKTSFNRVRRERDEACHQLFDVRAEIVVVVRELRDRLTNGNMGPRTREALTDCEGRLHRFIEGSFPKDGAGSAPGSQPVGERVETINEPHELPLPPAPGAADR